MDRKKIITAAGTTAAVFAILAAGGTSPSDAVSVTWGAARHAALLTAGIKLPDNTTAFPARNSIFSEEEQPLTEESPPECTEAAELQLTLEEAELTAEQTEQTEQTPESPQPTAVTSEAPSEPYARVITQNIAEFDDGVDRTSAGNRSGPIYRKHYGGYVGDDYIDLPGGGVVWNCASDSAEKLTARGHIQDPHYISMSFGLKLSVANLHLFSPSCLYYFLSGYVPLPGTALRISRFSLLHSVPDRQVLLAVFPVAILLRIAGEAGTACLVRPVKNAV